MNEDIIENDKKLIDDYKSKSKKSFNELNDTEKDYYNSQNKLKKVIFIFIYFSSVKR